MITLFCGIPGWSTPCFLAAFWGFVPAAAKKWPNICPDSMILIGCGVVKPRPPNRNGRIVISSKWRLSFRDVQLRFQKVYNHGKRSRISLDTTPITTVIYPLLTCKAGTTSWWHTLYEASPSPRQILSSSHSMSFGLLCHGLQSRIFFSVFQTSSNIFKSWYLRVQ